MRWIARDGYQPLLAAGEIGAIAEYIEAHQQPVRLR